MRIGVVGDTHNRMTNVGRIVEIFREARVERIVHTGDITQPRVLEEFATLRLPLLGVYGNNDRGERERLAREADRFDMDLADPPQRIDWVGRKIIVVHDPDEAHGESLTGLDLILHGHTHRHRHERLGETLVFNPGECAGHRAGSNAVGIVDLISLDVELRKF